MIQKKLPALIIRDGIFTFVYQDKSRANCATYFLTQEQTILLEEQIFNTSLAFI
jgi:hypothetical protein